MPFDLNSVASVSLVRPVTLPATISDSRFTPVQQDSSP